MNVSRNSNRKNEDLQSKLDEIGDLVSGDGEGEEEEEDDDRGEE